MSFSDPIEINKKHVLFLVVIVMLYVYLNDALKNPSYQSQVSVDLMWFLINVFFQFLNKFYKVQTSV